MYWRRCSNVCLAKEKRTISPLYFIHVGCVRLFQFTTLFAVVFALLTHASRRLIRTNVRSLCNFYLNVSNLCALTLRIIDILVGLHIIHPFHKCTQVKMFCLIWVRLVWAPKLAFVWFLFFSLSFSFALPTFCSPLLAYFNPLNRLFHSNLMCFFHLIQLLTSTFTHIASAIVWEWIHLRNQMSKNRRKNASHSDAYAMTVHQLECNFTKKFSLRHVKCPFFSGKILITVLKFEFFPLSFIRSDRFFCVTKKNI